jgi:hypothetical protein
MKSDNEKIRFQVDLDAESAERLEKLRVEAGSATKKQLFNTALSLLQWAAKETAKGRQIGSRGAIPTDFTRLLLPVETSGEEQQASPENAPIIRTLGELLQYIESLDYLSNESDDSYEFALGRMLELLPTEFERQQQLKNRTFMHLLHDALVSMVVEGPDIMDVEELRRRQIREPQHSVTVFARNFLDLTDLYDVVVENLQRGICYTYWQPNHFRFDELRNRLAKETRLKGVSLNDLMTCIILPELFFVTDFLIYDEGQTSMKGYINKLRRGLTIELLPMDPEHLNYLHGHLDSIYQSLKHSGGVITISEAKARLHKVA